MTNFTLFKYCSVKMVKMRAAIDASMVCVRVSVGRSKAIAGELLTLADNTPTAAGYFQHRLLEGFDIIIYSITGMARGISGAESGSSQSRWLSSGIISPSGS